MLRELVCHHISKGTNRYLSLSRPVYRMGKALDNDIVLLDVDVSPYLTTLEKKNGVYTWFHQEKQIDAEKIKFEVGEYVFFVRNNSSWMRTVLFVGVFLSFLMVFEHAPFKNAFKSSLIALPAKGTFGNLDPKEPVQSIKFGFQSGVERYSVLHYTPGNLETDQDLEIQINGKFLALAPASPGKWNVEQTHLIPVDAILEKENIIAFVYRNKTPNPWGVRDIYIDASEEKPVTQNGMEMIKNAQKLYRERNVRPGNLVRAEQLIRQAGLFYYSSRKPYPAALEKLAVKIKEEKMQMINDHQILIQKYKEQGDARRASLMYRKLMDELVDPVDPDRNKILRESGSA